MKLSIRAGSLGYVTLLIILATTLNPPLISIASAVPAQTTALVENAAPAAEITSLAMNEAWDILHRTYEETISQYEVSKHLETIMRSEGADVPLSFYTKTISGNELRLHPGIPSDDEDHFINPLSEPIAIVEMGCKYQNHSSDMTRTYFLDSASQEMFEAYNAVLAAQDAAIDATSPGIEISALDQIVRFELSEY
ncbi:MAG: M24 family metallopeptidase, partial [Candidatus Thorarchaeota archaeon]